MLALAESEEEVRRRIREDVYAKEEVWDLESVQIWPVCLISGSSWEGVGLGKRFWGRGLIWRLRGSSLRRR